MSNERLVLCGGVSNSGVSEGGRPALQLRIYGTSPNVHFHLDEVRKAIWKDIPPALRDLMDIALYVYAADQAVPRGTGAQVEGPEIGAGWRRKLVFRIPVRCLDLWNNDSVCGHLTSALSFLSEDEYVFEFSHLRKDPPIGPYLNFDTTRFDGHVEEVMLFSGGLDSLAGAVREAVQQRRQVLLVHHRSTGKAEPRYRQLISDLAQHAGHCPPIHFPVRANKGKEYSRESTQRTRSFLFSAFGATLASMIGLGRIRFYENGVLSLNLPLTAQLVGARASRTTHPRALAGLQDLLGAVLGRPFVIENPFIWRTKTEVVQLLGETGCQDLIKHSNSCANTRRATREHPHCGVCSQCIDRRFAVLAAGLGVHDPANAYGVDLLTGSRGEGEETVMLVAYLDLVNRVEQMNANDFLPHFGEAARSLRYLGLSPDAAALGVFELYRRHAQQVAGVIDEAIATKGREIRRRTLPATCLLRLVSDGGEDEHVESLPPAVPKGNYFLRRGRCWVIRYGEGNEAYYLADRGFDYLRVLLDRPGDYTAAELELAACRHAIPRSSANPDGEGLSVVSTLGADDISDAEAREAYRVRLQEVETRIEIAAASGSLQGVDELDELERERDFLRAEFDRTKPRGGKARPLDAERDLVRNRLCNAIRRAIKQIREFDPSLEEHLRLALRLGHRIRYHPPAEQTWTMEG